MASPVEDIAEESQSLRRETYSDILLRKIDSMVEKAERAMAEGDYKQCIAILSRGISLDPSNHTLFKLRAAAFFSQSDYTLAIANYNKTISLCPAEAGGVAYKLANAHFKRGEKLLGEGDYNFALADFIAASQLHPGKRIYTMSRMDCLLSLGRCEECLGMIQEELARGPPTPQLHLLHAKINLLFEKSGEAYQSILQALQLEPACHEALQLKRQREEEGRRLQEQAVKFLLLGQRDGALNKISAAIECDPQCAEFHVLRGAIYRQSGHYVRAVDELLTAVDKCKGERGEGGREGGGGGRGPTYSAACRQLVLTYNDFAIQCFKREKFSEAVKLLNKALEEEKNEAGLYVNRGDCFCRLNNLRFALGDYCRAQHLSPSDWQIRCRVAVTQCELGVKEFTSGHFKEAETLFSNAITNNPKVSQFYFYRARTRYELKMTEETRQDLLQLLVLDPECDAALPLIARVFPGKTRSDLLNSCSTMATTSVTSVSNRDDKVEVKQESLRDSLTAKRQRELEELFVQLGLVEGGGEGREGREKEREQTLQVMAWPSVLWITRVSCAAKEHDVNYSRFINGLVKCDVELNRKVLSELAIHEPRTFQALAEIAKKRLNDGLNAVLDDDVITDQSDSRKPPSTSHPSPSQIWIPYVTKEIADGDRKIMETSV